MSDDDIFAMIPELRPKVVSNEDLEKRVAELSADYRRSKENAISIISKLGSQPSTPGQGEWSLPGYVILKRCKEVLENPPMSNREPPLLPPDNNSTPEQRRTILVNLIWGWSAYRFVARKVDMQAVAASRWVESRQKVLATPDSNEANKSHRYRLFEVDTQLRNRIDDITDQYVYDTMLTEDTSKGSLMNEDPILQKTLLWFRTPR